MTLYVGDNCCKISGWRYTLWRENVKYRLTICIRHLHSHLYSFINDLFHSKISLSLPIFWIIGDFADTSSYPSRNAKFREYSIIIKLNDYVTNIYRWMFIILFKIFEMYWKQHYTYQSLTNAICPSSILISPRCLHAYVLNIRERKQEDKFKNLRIINLKRHRGMLL